MKKGFSQQKYSVDFEDIFSRIDTRVLFRSYWRAGRLADREYEHARVSTFEPMLRHLYEMIHTQRLWNARVWYRICKAFAQGTGVRLYCDESREEPEKIEFEFGPSPKNGESAARFITREYNEVAVQAVTIGAGISRKSSELFSDDRYSEGFYLHGLGTCMTELLAGYVSERVREKMKVSQGKRFSFGYPGMPPVEQQEKLCASLPITEYTGIRLTSAFQMEPEHSTIGLFLPNPRAQYLH